MNDRKIGVWLIGALGSISTTVMLGALALRKNLIGPTGMVTATEPFSRLGLAPVEIMEFGGCDVRRESLRDAARQIARETGCIDPAILNQIEADLALIDRDISPGTSRNCGEAIGRLAGEADPRNRPLREEIARVIGLLNDFKAAKQVQEVVVVNLASTEPPLEFQECHEDLPAFEDCLDRNENEAVRASTIYAYAAIQAGYPYINFTPSSGALFPAMVRLAEARRVPVMGNDGKTGETLVKSALAPMFMCRNLEVLSWEGFNILGNMDGRVLAHPENKESKILSKDGVLSKILGYSPHSEVHINYVPSLCDQKTAWDFIHFRGFLGAKMSLQFVWQGYDSFLAAPLILDLARLAEFAKRRGEAGLMPHLASYFKDPLAGNEHRLYEQFRMLQDYGTRAESAVLRSELR
ncbi:MAG: inositol-3-phosphate synthase [Desulfomonile tiedjei]|uniref:Inositol-3-phosphate synthase n=1 Tax=Desulfomonile tiedjei TaxID=2358 RepID=A0A9D6UZ16_9BACT|nr:inositol-3-phosphate synthase [Desulfomonile tiedjei]